MSRPYRARFHDPDRSPAARLCRGIFPMAENRRRPGDLLGRAGNARHPAARRISTSRAASRRPSAASPSTSASTRDFDAVIDGCARGDGRPSEHLDQPADPHSSTATLFAIGHCHTRRSLGGRRAGRRALRRDAGAAFFGESMFSRRTRCLEGLPGRIWWSGCATGLRPARHAVHDRAPEALRRDRRAAAQIRDDAGKGVSGSARCASHGVPDSSCPAGWPQPIQVGGGTSDSCLQSFSQTS